jgi:protein MpaA
LEPRNQWVVVPIANPDGLKQHSRTNMRGVDLNRNFPTAQWDADAIHNWETRLKKDPRRYPGPQAASEVETACLLSLFEKFKPDLYYFHPHSPGSFGFGRS